MEDWNWNLFVREAGSGNFRVTLLSLTPKHIWGGSVAEWLACWTQAQKARVQIAVATLSGNSLRQTVHTNCASVHQAAKLIAPS